MSKSNVIQLHPPKPEHHHTRPTVMADNMRRVQRVNQLNVFFANFIWAAIIVFMTVMVFGAVMS